MSRFTTKTEDRADWISAGDLIGRCSAAARMALRGANWSAEDRADVAAVILCKAWETARATDGAIRSDETVAVRSSVNGGPKVLYSKYSAQKSKDTRAVSARETYVRADVCAWTWLLQRAADERRSMEASRRRELETAANAPVEFDPFIPAPADETGGTPWDARRTAVEMLRALGMVGDRITWGPLWTLAYAAARAVESTDANGERGGIDRETVARELELDPATVRQHIARAVARIPAAANGYGTRSAWADALYIPEGGRAVKPSRSRAESADMGTRHNGPRERLAPKDHAPVTERRAARIKRASVDAWTRGPSYRPEWTRDLDTRTANRLEAAARIRLERTRAQTEDAPDSPALYGLAR